MESLVIENLDIDQVLSILDKVPREWKKVKSIFHSSMKLMMKRIWNDGVQLYAVYAYAIHRLPVILTVEFDTLLSKGDIQIDVNAFSRTAYRKFESKILDVIEALVTSVSNP